MEAVLSAESEASMAKCLCDDALDGQVEAF
jgi:hypothetical protein